MNYYSRKSIPGPDNILRKELDNGIILLARENLSSPTAVISASIPCGSYLDPLNKTGLADFAANCLNTGTYTHNFMQLSEILENSGASLGIGCGPRAFTIHGKCLAEDLPLLLGLTKEILDEPSFPADHLEIHRQRVLSAYELHLHDPESMSNELFDKLLFGEQHPYGRPEFGTIDETNSITRDDLLDFHKKYIGPKNMILSISGGISKEKMLEECEKQIGTWKKSQENIDISSFFPLPPAPNQSITEHIEIPEKSEISLIMGTMGPKRGSSEYLTALLANSILGEFGMMGRIGKAVRQDNGLAYQASSSLTALTYGGCWTIEAGINPGNVEKTVDLIIKELKRFTSEKVSYEELEDVKSFFLNSRPLSLESNSGISALLLNIEGFSLGLDYLIRLQEIVEKITTEDILQTAKTWLDPEKLIRVTAGTLSE